MKIHFLLLCLLISGGIAGAATQTSFNQDKPSYIDVKSYSMTDKGSWYYTYDFGSSLTVSFSGNVPNWGDNSPGTASWKSHFEAATTFDDQPEDAMGDFTSNWRWPASSWPSLLATVNGTYNYVDSPDTSPDGSGAYTNANQGVPVFMEYCDINVSSNFSWYDGELGVIDTVRAAERRTAQMTVTLHTGGKGTSKLRNVFGISAWGNEIHPNDPYDVYPGMNPIYGYSGGNGYLYERAIGDPVLAQTINIGSFGHLNVDEVLYKVLPDNANVDVTPFVAGVDYYSFGAFATKYHSYYDLFVQQANPGYSFSTSSREFDIGHAFWRFRTDVPNDALQYVSPSLTSFLGTKWGFYPTNDPLPVLSNGYTVPGFVQDDGSHSYNIQRTFYVGFPDLLNGLQQTRSIYLAPPQWAAISYNCVDAAASAAYAAHIYTLPLDTTPQNFGVMLVLMYPGPFDDETDIFYTLPPVLDY